MGSSPPERAQIQLLLVEFYMTLLLSVTIYKQCRNLNSRCPQDISSDTEQTQTSSY